MVWDVFEAGRILLEDLVVLPFLLVLLLACDQGISLVGVLDLEGSHGLLGGRQGLFGGFDGSHLGDRTEWDVMCTKTAEARGESGKERRGD